MIRRSAPDTGYDFAAKRQYRRDVWASFRKYCPVPRSEAKALLMPSLEGDEIETALANGFREANLLIVDKNPAIVATLKRRFTRVKTYGVDLRRAAERIKREFGPVDVANLDLCGPATRKTYELISETVGLVARFGTMVAVTYLCGREQAADQKLWAKEEDQWILLENDKFVKQRIIRTNAEARAEYILDAITDGTEKADINGLRIYKENGLYKSTAGNQRMGFVIAQAGCSE